MAISRQRDLRVRCYISRSQCALMKTQQVCFYNLRFLSEVMQPARLGWTCELSHSSMSSEPHYVSAHYQCQLIDWDCLVFALLITNNLPSKSVLYCLKSDFVCPDKALPVVTSRQNSICTSYLFYPPIITCKRQQQFSWIQIPNPKL